MYFVLSKEAYLTLVLELGNGLNFTSPMGSKLRRLRVPS